MLCSGLRRSLTTLLATGACLSTLLGAVSAHAAPVRQGAPPVGMNVTRPTVSGTLLARPGSDTGKTGQVLCNDRDRAPDVRTLVPRGLVLCTAEGRLVLLQLSATTRFYGRHWEKWSVDRLVVGDHLDAWGILKDNGLLLDPTFAVRDISRPNTDVVIGTLIARPDGDNPGTFQCNNRDRTPDVQALMVNRGLVLCTRAGRVILVALDANTKIRARYGTAASVNSLTAGDRIVAYGILRDNGLLMNPTYAVYDTDIQAKSAASQDFIAQAGSNLMLYVLRSDAGGPVTGIIHAIAGPDTRVLLCDGRKGTWANLTAGMVVDITGSLFNRRTMTYVDTELVRVVNCR